MDWLIYYSMSVEEDNIYSIYAIFNKKGICIEFNKSFLLY